MWMRLVTSLCLVAALACRGSQEPPPPLADHHQHLFSPTITQRAAGLDPVDSSDLVSLLDAAGIRRAVVLSLAYQFSNPNRPRVEHEYAHVKAENDWTAQQVARFPDRLRGFCSLNPLQDYALDELARCAAIHELRSGLKLHFGNSDVNLRDAQHVAQLRRVFTAANEKRMAIVVHMRSSVTRRRPYGAESARAFLTELLPAAPGVPVQIAHLAGAGGYDDPLVDEALSVFVDAIAGGDARMTRVLFDVSGVAGLGEWESRATLIATRMRQLGFHRLLYGSDGAGGGNLAPREAWRAFRRLPLTEAEFRIMESNVAPYLR
jgi:predicted TIM-barrel fold metal-dependent hydrolase